MRIIQFNFKYLHQIKKFFSKIKNKNIHAFQYEVTTFHQIREIYSHFKPRLHFKDVPPTTIRPCKTTALPLVPFHLSLLYDWIKNIPPGYAVYVLLNVNTRNNEGPRACHSLGITLSAILQISSAKEGTIPLGVEQDFRIRCDTREYG